MGYRNSIQRRGPFGGILANGDCDWNTSRTLLLVERSSHTNIHRSAEWNGFEYLTVDYENFSQLQTFGVVVVPPSILANPQNASLLAGQAVTFSVSVNAADGSIHLSIAQKWGPDHKRYRSEPIVG